MHKKALALLMALVMLFVVGCNNTPTEESKPASSDPTVSSEADAGDAIEVTIWHYFSGQPQAALDEIVKEFNEGPGQEAGIVVKAESQGKTADLEKKVQTASDGGVQNLPDIVHGYPDIMATLHAKEQIADLGSYLSEEELDGYYESYIREGSQFGDDALRLLPIAKSTELMFYNRTHWDAVKDTIGCTDEDLATWEGIAKAGKAYYEAFQNTFFVIGSYANFVYLNGYQQGVEYIDVENGQGVVNPDRAALERTFNFIKQGLDEGWLVYRDATKQYSSDWMNDGTATCYVDSNSGTTYVHPKSTTTEDEEELAFMTYPVWSDAVNKAVIQQGAGMAIVKKGEEVEKAAATFLVYLTNPANSARFSMATAYLPANKYAAEEPVYAAFLDGKDADGADLDVSNARVAMATKTALEQFATYDMYYTPAFDGSNLIRRAVDENTEKIFTGLHTDFDSFYTAVESSMQESISGR